MRNRFEILERQVRTLVCLTGISRVISLVLGGVIVCGLVDWLLHVNDPGLRLLLGLGLAAGIGWTAWRRLWTPLAERHSSSLLASMLERRRPYIGNQLSSAAEFLEHGLDARLGSPLLQQAVVDQAEHRLASLDFDAIIDRREARNHALLAAAICGAALVLIVCRPTDAATAVTRLLFPFSDTPWPRCVELQLVEHDLAPWRTADGVPHRVARGDTLELYARNLKGALPDDIQLEYRIGDDRVIREPMRKTILRDDEGHPFDVAGVNLPVARGPILLRAVGGDDDRMAFVPIEVVLPAEITLLQIRLQPPGYTGRPLETLPDGVGDIQAMFGTKVSLGASVSQQLSDAALVFQGGDRVPLTRSADGMSISGEFTLDNPKVTGYRIELTNVDGFGSGERSTLYAIRLTPDQVPQVTLEEPAGDVTVTADAVLPLRISIKDDLGLTSVRLAYQREQQPEVPPKLLTEDPNRPTDQRLTTDWSLEELKLSPGERLLFLIEATDAFDLGPPHVGRSATRTVTVIGAEEKREELTNRLAELLADLSQSIAVQRRVAEQTQQLQTDLESEPVLRPQDADLLRKLDLEQQRVLHQLLDPGGSVRAQAQRLLDEFEANDLSSAETTERLEALAEALTELGRETLPELQRGLTQAQKQAASATAEATEQLAGDLKDIGEQQADALRTLEELESGLSGWRDRRHVAQQLSGLIETQKALNRSTRTAAEQQLARDAGQTPPSERAENQRLAQRQRMEADAIEQFRKHLEEMADSQADKDPEMADRLKELAEELDRAGIAGQLRDAAASLAEGRPAQASQQQEEGLRKLEELENRLDNRPPDDQELLVKQMQQLEDDLEALQKNEEQLAKDVQAALDQPAGEAQEEALEKLEKRQEELREELADIERQLERLQLQKPRDAARRAGQRMDRMSDRGQQPGERQEALQETLDDLEQARRELAQERQQAEEELAFEQLLKLKDELQGLAGRQTSVFDEVRRLEELRAARGEFTRAQLKTLAQTAQTELELAQLVETLAGRMEAVEVLALALRRVGSRMQSVSGSLQQRQTDEPVQRNLQAIEDQLLRLVSVLDSAEGAPDGKPSADAPTQEPPAEQPAGPPGDVVTLIAQLELLKDLQADCAQRTTELQERSQATGDLTAAETLELEALLRDQAQLTDLARNLLTKLLQSTEGPSAKPGDTPAPEGGL